MPSGAPGGGAMMPSTPSGPSAASPSAAASEPAAKPAETKAEPKPAAKKDAAGTASVQAILPQPPAPGPLVPKPPFGMSAMPVAHNIKIAKPTVVPKRDDAAEEPDIKHPE